jgi:hypothetical protein
MIKSYIQDKFINHQDKEFAKVSMCGEKLISYSNYAHEIYIAANCFDRKKLQKAINNCGESGLEIAIINNADLARINIKKNTKVKSKDIARYQVVDLIILGKHKEKICATYRVKDNFNKYDK